MERVSTPLLRDRYFVGEPPPPTISWSASSTNAVKIIVAVIMLSVLLMRTDNSDSFLEQDDDANDYSLHTFATKTVYWNQQRHSLHVGGDANRTLRILQTQIVSRHGIRYPTLDSIEKLDLFLTRLQDHTELLPSWLQTYTMPYNTSVQGTLAATGAQEMKALGRRVWQMTGSAFPPTYTNETFQVSHSDEFRTRDSAIAFAQTYFRNPQDVTYNVRPKHDDIFLRFFDMCPRYTTQVKKNASTTIEKDKFAKTDEVIEECKNLRRTLGLEGTSFNISAEELNTVYSACAFDLALYGISSQWCSLLTVYDISSMEFMDDLESYYLLGAGHSLNYKMAGVLLHDILSTLEHSCCSNQRKINGISTPEDEYALRGKLRFAHAETTLPLMTLLGLGRRPSKSDPDRYPLRANDTHHERNARLFRTSVLAPFASNIIFQLYTETPEHLAKPHIALDKTDPNYVVKDETCRHDTCWVQVLANEKILENVEGCLGRSFCPLEVLKKKWKHLLLDQDTFTKMCEINT